MDETLPGDAARAILERLRDGIRRRVPAWREVGAEDPTWAVLEVFAQALAEARAEIEGLDERLFPRFLEALGEAPRWASAAEGAVVFRPEEGSEEPVRIPRGTAIVSPRATGEPPVSFETLDDAWSSRARLLRVVLSSDGPPTDIFAYPEGGWDAGPVSLFGERSRIVRHLYLGDPILWMLRDRRGALVLDWPGVPSVIADGRWETSVRGGWRALRVDLEEVQLTGQRRGLRVRIPGPIPDLADASVRELISPWLRLVLPGDRRVVLPQAAWSGAEFEPLVGAFASVRRGGGPAPVAPSLPSPGFPKPTFPRPIARVLSEHEDRWEDHSLSGEKIVAAESPDARDASVYLGWEGAVPASVYWSLAVRPTSAAWAAAGALAPRLAWEYSCGRTFRPLEVRDGTRSFTRGGTVSWDLPSEWTPQEHFGERLHWVRARWVGGSFLAPPVVRAVLAHAAAVRQGRTLSGQVLEARIGPAGRGSIGLDRLGGEPAPLEEIEVARETGEWTRLVGPSTFRLVRGLDGGFSIQLPPRWSGLLRFRLPSIRVGLGSRGNLPAGSLSVLAADVPGVRRVEQPLSTDGGRDPEGADAFRRRVAAEWKTGSRAVTPADYRRLCFSLDPDVARVEVLASPSRPGRVLVCVVPSDPCRPGRLSPEKVAWLEGCLGEKAPLGTVVEVVEPIYLTVDVRIRQVAPGAGSGPWPWPGDPSRRRLEERLRSFFHPLRGGPDGRGFHGRWLKDEDLLAIISVALGTGVPPPADGEVAPGREAGGRSQWSSGWWDPRGWRAEWSPSGGGTLPEGLDLWAAGGWVPLVFPLLERVFFELADSSSAR